MPLSFQIVTLGSQLVMTAADQPPSFDMAATCRLHITAVYGVAAGPHYEKCMQNEQSALDQLQRQWLKFPDTARTHCASWETVGSAPSYVGLLTCLQAPAP
jgi:hypothetical protein